MTLKIATGDVLFEEIGPEGYVASRPVVDFVSLESSCDGQLLEDRLELRYFDEPVGFDGDVEWRRTGWELVGGVVRARVANQPACVDPESMIITVNATNVVDGTTYDVLTIVVRAESFWDGLYNQATFVK